MTADSRYLVPLAGAAHHLGISAYRLRYFVLNGYVPYHNDSGRLRFDLAELDEWAALQVGRDELAFWHERQRSASTT